MHQLILMLCECTNSHGARVFKGDMDQQMEFCNGSRGFKPVFQTITSSRFYSDPSVMAESTGH